MRHMLILLLLLSGGAVQAAQAIVTGVRVWPAPDHLRLVFDASAPIEHSLFTLDDPPRLVIDLHRTRLDAELPSPPRDDALLEQFRSAPRNGGDLRVVLDLKAAARPKSFPLKPNARYGHRLVVDIYAADSEGTGSGKVAKTLNDGNLRDVVIAIDAGHGGEDPGAQGPRGVSEKDVVLAIARRMARRIDARPGMRALLVRDGDYYIGLRDRMEKARRHNADLFISIHADAFRDRRVTGASVYTLSVSGASDEQARRLAEKENSSDEIGGLKLAATDDLLAKVLLELSQNQQIEQSTVVAREVLGELRGLGRLHKQQVQRAGFVVLKSPDVPSILVETAFISNPREERRLNDPRQQQRLADALADGVWRHFRSRPPPGTRLAAEGPREHRIASGETLSQIAAQYRIGLGDLRAANGLEGDLIRVGQVLRIPGG